MIETRFVSAWKQIAPWPSMAQVEQDLIISRVLVELYNHPIIKKNLAFRGGTALNKLFLRSAARYSEDIDFVQCNIEPIGETLNAITNILDKWLGQSEWEHNRLGHRLIYHYQSIENTKSRLKIEINTSENNCFFDDYLGIIHTVNSEWFSGSTMIKTYQLNELLGSKMRALFQREKGRDLFDLWFAHEKLPLDPEIIIKVFLDYMDRAGRKITRAIFEMNLYKKVSKSNFTNDVDSLIRPEINWNFNEAFNKVLETFVYLLPGAPWKGEEN